MHRWLAGITPLWLLLCLGLPGAASASVVTIGFTGTIGATNSFDTDNLFGQGAGANLAGETLSGTITINPDAPTETCGTGGACYSDHGGGAISVSFTVGDVSSTVLSDSILGFGTGPGGTVTIRDSMNGGCNYFGVSATNPFSTLTESVGAMFDVATLFSAYGGDPASPNPTAAIDSLAAIGNGAGFATGGVTLMTPGEHIDAEITGISVVPEPDSTMLLAGAIGMLPKLRRRR